MGTRWRSPRGTLRSTNRSCSLRRPGAPEAGTGRPAASTAPRAGASREPACRSATVGVGPDARPRGSPVPSDAVMVTPASGSATRPGQRERPRPPRPAPGSLRRRARPALGRLRPRSVRRSRGHADDQPARSRCPPDTIGTSQGANSLEVPRRERLARRKLRNATSRIDPACERRRQCRQPRG